MEDSVIEAQGTGTSISETSISEAHNVSEASISEAHNVSEAQGTGTSVSVSEAHGTGTGTSVSETIISVSEASASAGASDPQFNSLLLDLSSMKTLINEMQTKVKLLEKSVIKGNKENEKENERKKKEELKLHMQQRNQPSGFDTPVAITAEMCSFMNKPIGSLVSRPFVADYMINYIRINKLQDMINRKKINPNETLNNLLKSDGSGEDLTYFNLQKYLNKHFN